ncbi:MAG: cyclic nucleotide-binding domain-containing protein [Verrucomicrobia bacterium]|nr:cyclic nucleotide-binding domain-containing protein [Verrucomicrobiota bacterium]
MNTFEKLLFLKSLSLFKYVKDEVLLGLAPLLEEQVVKAGEMIIKKGELGTTMYLIVTGRVKIHDGERILKEMGDHEVFGELSALSPEIRTASATALEEALLLKITHQVLEDLMEIEPGLSKGIIHVLCQRARSIASDLNQFMISQ